MEISKALIIIGLFLVACSPQKRFTKLIEKHPYLLTSDTLIVKDTIRLNIPSVKVDTFFKTDLIKDTITIIKDHFHTKIWKSKDTVFVVGGCDTVKVEKIIERRIPVKYYEKKKRDYLKILLVFMFLLFISYHLLKIIKNK